MSACQSTSQNSARKDRKSPPPVLISEGVDNESVEWKYCLKTSMLQAFFWDSPSVNRGFAITILSLMTGIPLDEMLDECLSEYIEVTIETGYEDLAERAATA
jgi:hypothetical protein